MTERVPLRDYRNSRAVLIGTSRYDNLGQVPAAEHSLRLMTALLTGSLCDWPRSRITTRLNWRTSAQPHQRLIEAYQDVTDVAFFYFVGHAQPDDNDALCLGLPGSSDRPHLRAATSIDFADVRDALIRSPAATKIVFLDCCASGLGQERTFSLGARELASRTDGLGGYVLAAAPGYEPARYETAGERPLTYFTRYLAEVSTTGIPGEPAGLRLHAIYRRLRELMTANGLPAPVERNIDQAGEFVFARNAATAGGPGPRRRPRPLARSAASSKPGGRSRSGDLLACAARCLRQRRGVAFRQVEAELSQFGLSARPTAALTTSRGEITVRLLPDYAPTAVREFIDRASGPRHSYDDTVFHRVEPGRLIQGGEWAEGERGGGSDAGPAEHHPELAFDRPYLVGLTNAGPDASGSQFFITLTALPWLTGRHPIIGQVLTGHSIIDAISQVPASQDGRPLEPVRIISVSITGDLLAEPGGQRSVTRNMAE